MFEREAEGEKKLFILNLKEVRRSPLIGENNKMRKWG